MNDLLALDYFTNLSSHKRMLKLDSGNAEYVADSLNAERKQKGTSIVTLLKL